MHDPDVVARIAATVAHDWEHSRPLDLTDAGLLAELGDLDPNVREDLALDCEPTHKHHH